MNNCFIILAAGESKRFKSKTPKPYYLYRGKPLFLHSIDKAKESKKFNKILLVISKKHKRFIKNIRLKNIRIITGGKNRSESSLKALKSIKNSKISKYMHKNEWTKHYNSLYLGRVPRINGSVWHMNPRYVVKTFDQQLPLSLHLVNMDSLKDNWDPLYAGYQIE
mgnify:CR=1 FL=1